VSKGRKMKAKDVKETEKTKKLNKNERKVKK
jgi:hypothetical protein